MVCRPRHARDMTAGAAFTCWLCRCDRGVGRGSVVAMAVAVAVAIVATVILYVAVAAVLDVAETTVLAIARRG